MTESQRPVRVRFAPSPTGMLHVGGARTALFNWAFARREGGRFLLRIEDTDPERSKHEYEVGILEGLRWLGLDWDEGPDVGGDLGPYRQSERFDRYAAVRDALLERGVAYRCFCTPERVNELRARQREANETPRYDGRCREIDVAEGARRAAAGESCAVRFRVPDGETRLVDLIRGDVRFANEEVDDWVMVRGDGSPTYNFVVVCDDVDMRITHVLRGEEHLSNTPKQVLLYQALGEPVPEFAHFPLMLGKDKKKLSKRTGDTALQDYRDNGYPPEAVMNFLALQGWALDDKTDVFDAETLCANFDLAKGSKAGAIFDPEKFVWMAGEYIRMDSVERVADRCAPFFVAEGLVDAADVAEGGARRAWFTAAIALIQERIQLYGQAPKKLAWLFADDDAVAFDPKAEKGARKHDGAVDTLAAYREWVAPRVAGAVDAAALRDATKAWIADRGLKIPALFQPLRCALTGEPGGPDLFDVIAVLGGEKSLRRIEAGEARLR